MLKLYTVCSTLEVEIETLNIAITFLELVKATVGP